MVEREGVSRLHFQRGLMPELRLQESNTVVLFEINSEHFCKCLRLDLGSDTNYCTQNRINHIQDNKNLRGSTNDAYVHESNQ